MTLLGTRPIVLALVGMSGTGKSLAVKYLQDRYACEVVYFGGVVLEELARRGLAITEDNEAKVRVELRETYGMAAMAIKREDAIRTIISRERDAVIDGLYSYSEYQFLHGRLADQLKLIATHAPKCLRLKRLNMRLDRPLSAEQVDQRDTREITALEKGGPIAIADYHVVNSGTEHEYYAALDQIIGKLGRRGA